MGKLVVVVAVLVAGTALSGCWRQGAGGAFGFVFTGAWEDDGDGIPEDPATTDDDIECTGVSTALVAGRSRSASIVRSKCPR